MCFSDFMFFMKSFDVAKMFMVFYSHYKTHMQQAYSNNATYAFNEIKPKSCSQYLIMTKLSACKWGPEVHLYVVSMWQVTFISKHKLYKQLNLEGLGNNAHMLKHFLTTIEYVEKAGILAFLMLTTQSKLNSSFFQFSSRNGN